MFKELEIKIRETEENINQNKKELKEKENHLSELQSKLKMAYAGVNINYVDIAKKLIYVKGIKFINRGACPFVIDKAVKDITKGFEKMRYKYFGAIDYERWTCSERIECCYGSLPSYYDGSTTWYSNVTFEIGMTDEARKRKNFTGQEIDACLYYLRNLKKIKEVLDG